MLEMQTRLNIIARKDNCKMTIQMNFYQIMKKSILM